MCTAEHPTGKVFYMAVDGVAPRAKMNQQRARRFRAAKDAEEAAKKNQRSVWCIVVLRDVSAHRGAQGKISASSAPRFDSNCITPGTPFMTRLNDYLKYYVHFNISSNPDWQGIRVILSGHDVCVTCVVGTCDARLGTGRGRAQDHGLHSKREVSARLRRDHAPLHVRSRC